MKFQLFLKDNYYEEVPAGYRDTIQENVIAEITLDDIFEAYERPKRFFIGEDGDLVLKQSGLYFSISHQNLEVTGNIAEELVYWNRRRLRESRVRILKGDCLLAGNTKIIFFTDHIRIYANNGDYETELLPVMKKAVPFTEYLIEFLPITGFLLLITLPNLLLTIPSQLSNIFAFFYIPLEL